MRFHPISGSSLPSGFSAKKVEELLFMVVDCGFFLSGSALYPLRSLRVSSAYLAWGFVAVVDLC